jgi:UDP-N-acetylglucosamine 2-epimerase (non-hydrolysing)
MPIVFPVHPRTKKIFSFIEKCPKNIKIIPPQGYIDFMNLILNSAYVISDSGGVQEETTYLGIPCFTLRNTTERPITLTIGSNQIVSIDNLLEKIQHPKMGEIPPLWDGKAAERIKNIIKTIL